jgi:hypothetical protein
LGPGASFIRVGGHASQGGRTRTAPSAGGARTLPPAGDGRAAEQGGYSDGYDPFGYTTKGLLGVNSALGTQLRSKYLADASMFAGWNNGVGPTGAEGPARLGRPAEQGTARTAG